MILCGQRRCSWPPWWRIQGKRKPASRLADSSLSGQPVCYSCASSSGRSPKYYAPKRAGEEDRALPNFVTSHSRSATGTRNADARTPWAVPRIDRRQASACCARDLCAHSTTAATIRGGPRQRTRGRGRCGPPREPGTAAGRGPRQRCPQHWPLGMCGSVCSALVRLRSHRLLRLQRLQPHSTQPARQTPCT